MSKEQREYLLRQQLRAIQQELGEKDADKAEIEMLRERFEKAESAGRSEEGIRAGAGSAGAAAGGRARLPRNTHLSGIRSGFAVEHNDGRQSGHRACARRCSTKITSGLKEIKERILEHLSVLKRNPDAKAPILCLVGAPGVGKTSLGQSVARALGRKFERFSLRRHA